MKSSTLGGQMRQAAREAAPVAIREGRVARVRSPGLFEVAIRSLLGDTRTLLVRGPAVELARGTNVWAGQDEGGQWVMLSFADVSGFEALEARVDAIESGPEALRLVGAAGQPTMENGWVHFDTNSGTPGGTPAYRDAGFYRHAGRAYGQGVVKGGTIGLVPIFTLPPGYRPTSQRVFATFSNNAFAGLTVEPSGAVTCPIGSNVFVYLDSISFRL